MEKRITSIKVDNQDTPIKSKGETRGIKIHGTQGSGFSLEINDSTGHCILENPLQDVEIPQSGVYILNQNFPDISTNAIGGLVEEYYDITITPHADVTTEYKIESTTKSKEYKEKNELLLKYNINENSTGEDIKRISQEDFEEIERLNSIIVNSYFVKYDSLEKITLYQYPDLTITLTKSTSQTSPALSVAGGCDYKRRS